eukprot:4237674-Amphidinium_carterae.1
MVWPAFALILGLSAWRSPAFNTPSLELSFERTDVDGLYYSMNVPSADSFSFVSGTTKFARDVDLKNTLFW